MPARTYRQPFCDCRVYGPGDNQHRIFEYLKRMDDGRTAILLTGPGGWRWSRGYVENVAAAIALAATVSVRQAGPITSGRRNRTRPNGCAVSVRPLVGGRSRALPEKNASPPENAL